MELKVKSYSSQSSLISSIIFFIIGTILFTSPEESIAIVFKAIGLILTIGAVVEFVIYGLKMKNENPIRKRDLAFGIILLILAILFFFFAGIIVKIISFIIGAWIMFTGIIRLINVIQTSPKNKKFFPLLAVAIALIGIGIFTIIYGGTIIRSIGIIMMIYSAVEIIGFVLYTKDSKPTEEPGVTTLIVPEENDQVTETKDEKKKKKIKDVDENENK